MTADNAPATPGSDARAHDPALVRQSLDSVAHDAVAAPIIVVVGPTASGKSDLALDLADQLGGPDHVEIVGADAFQLYRGMDIGTAKLAPKYRRGYRHHQIDVLEVGEDASVARYQSEARADIASIQARGRRVIVVGGSGLYVRALIDDMNFPGTDAQVRERWLRRAEQVGVAALYDELVAKDPKAASRIEPANERRIIRALEVIDITGAPFSANLPRQQYVIPTIQIGIDYGREQLDERIKSRVASMWQSGLVQEFRELADRSPTGISRTALRAVGYRETADYLAGALTAAEAQEAIAAATRRLARKQMGWFGRDPRISWLRADALGEGDLVLEAMKIVRAADSSTLADTLITETAVPSAQEPTRRRLGS